MELSKYVPFVNGQNERQPIFDTAEIAAIIKYASEQGVEKDELVPELFKELRAWERANSAENAELQEQATEKMLSTYTKLTKELQGVNGRNLLSGRHLIRETRWFIGTTFCFFLLAISSLAFSSWFTNETPSDDWLLGYGAVFLHTLSFFTPFLWGALGAGVSILQTITEVAAENRFDPDKFKGWLTRLTLGGIMGGIITYVIDPSALGDVKLSIIAIAFLTGLGTKIVYGALFRLLQILGEKMNLSSLREQRSKKDIITEFIAKEILNTNPDTENEKYKVLTSLLESRAQP